MKNIKKLIIASVLSMITASCYAGSIVVGSEQLKFSGYWLCLSPAVERNICSSGGLKGWGD